MINWGITGFGVIAKEFEKAINTTKENKILSICTQKNIENKSDKIFFYKNEKEMLSLKDLDVVYISNLINMHPY